MALVEKLTYEERCILEVVENPVFFAEFIENFDNDGREPEWMLTDYQKEFLCDFSPYVSLCCGRSVGKTVSLTAMLLWVMINNFYQTPYIVYTVPNKVHLDPVFTTIVYKLRSNGFVKKFIEKRKGINASNHTIVLLNGATLDCRIAGQSGTGENVVGIHTPLIFLDESSFYPYGTWIELQPTLNTWERGFKLVVSGVPDGRREKSVCYFADQIDERFSKHRIPATKNPRFTEEDIKRAIVQYGGENSEDFKHLVLGEHGNPFYSVFDRSRMRIEQYPVYKLEFDGIELKEALHKYTENLSILPNVPADKFTPFFGIDLGYIDPTIILILYQDTNLNIKTHASITLKRVNYSIQERLIDFLDTKFRPSLIAIDEGNIGKAVIQHLMTEDMYRSKNYSNRIYPVSFGGTLVVAKDNEGKDVMERVKPFSVKILQEYADLHKIIFSSTYIEMVSELERMAYTKNPNGEIVYKTLNIKGGEKAGDHVTSALLCGILAHYIKNDLKLIEKKHSLFSARWL